MKLQRLMLALVLTAGALAVMTAAPVHAVEAPRTHLVFDESVEVWTAPPVDLDARVAEDRARERHARSVPRVSARIESDLTPWNSGRWERSTEGTSWTLAVRSTGALWISLGLDPVRLGDGGTLAVYDATGQFVSAFEDGTVVNQRLLVPPVAGDEVVLRLTWPRHVRPEPALKIDRVHHGYRSLSDAQAAVGLPEPAIGESNECNVDVNCDPIFGDWQDEKRGVVMIMVDGGAGIGGMGVCSGTLINNTDLDCRPLVLTADHCFTLAGTGMPEPDPPVNPQDTVFRFNVERPTCGGVGSPDPNQVLMGASTVGASAEGDFHLLQLNSSPPASFGVYYNGWNRTPLPPASSVGVHHPVGDVKKISFNTGAAQSFGQFWRVPGWSLGTMEIGSSGSPLFDGDGRVVGQLTSGSVTPCSGADNYGRLDVSWDATPRLGAMLQDALDPSVTGAMSLAGMDASFCGAVGPLLVHEDHTPEDVLGNRNGVVEPGDLVALEVDLRNVGPQDSSAADAVSLQALIPDGTAVDSTVTVVDGQTAFEAVAAGGTGSSEPPAFAIDISGSRACGRTIVLRLNNTGSLQAPTFRLKTGTAVAFQTEAADDLEGPLDAWTSVNLQGNNSWAPNTGVSRSPITSLAVEDGPNNTESALVSPTVPTLPPGARLTFWHRLASENGGDGGILEYSTDGGSVWNNAAPFIVEGGYNAYIRSDNNTRLAGELAWSGSLLEWQPVVMDLSELETRNLQLRWLFVTDQANSVGGGWFVDDVEIDAPVFDCDASPRVPGPGGYCLEGWPDESCGLQLPDTRRRSRR